MSALVVNFFGGPGTGKSTTAARIFAALKRNGLKAELVTEFAKDLTWENNKEALSCQAYCFGEQYYRMKRCIEKVDIIVTDSPLPLNIIYNTDSALDYSFEAMVMRVFNTHRNLNYLLTRETAYQQYGRNETLEKADIIQSNIVELLEYYQVDYTEVHKDDDLEEIIVQDVIKKLSEVRS